MEENRQRKPRRRLNSLILLVAFTAILLIVSTYAWFSTQKSVTLGGLEGVVNVAEGLQISLDGEKWTNSIDFKEVLTNPTKYLATADATLENPYTNGFNALPTEMLPVSTTAGEDEGIGTGSSALKMYTGVNDNGFNLHTIEQKSVTYTGEKDATNLLNRALGYYAIDFYLQNSSAAEVNYDQLMLEPNSDITLAVPGKEYTGLQNTLRVAFALFKNDGSANCTVGNQITGEALRTATSGDIIDVAMWEPNANEHVDYIVANNNNVKFSTADQGSYTGIQPAVPPNNTKFLADTIIPTYALTSDSVTQGTITDIYDWDTGAATAGLVKQKVLATPTSGIIEATQLKGMTTKNIALTTTDEAENTDDFVIAGKQYHKLRMYVWLEGQDVDCINYASHGGTVKIDLGISKPGSDAEAP